MVGLGGLCRSSPTATLLFLFGFGWLRCALVELS